MMNLKTELDAFVERIVTTRKLSFPEIDTVKTEEDYSRLLKKNFKTIGDVAKENRAMLDETLYPLLSSDELLPEEAVIALRDFCDLLLNPWPVEEIDLSLLYHVSDRLLRDAVEKQDDEAIVLQCAIHIYACYNNMNRVNRIHISEDLPDFYQKEGMKAAERILSYLSHEKFILLKTADSRSAVLSLSRFYVALYDTFYTTDEPTNDLRIRELERALSFANDPFFQEHAPEFDWHYHRIRILEHMSQLTENGNAWALTPEQCRKVTEYVDYLDALWHEDPEANEKILPLVHLELAKLRNNYFSHRIDEDTYRSGLLSMYEKWANTEYDMYSALANVFIPTEFLATVSADRVDEKTKYILRMFYRSITNYILHSSNTDAFSFLLEYLSGFLDRFIELPGEETFEKMGLCCLAALHPPTYVHSLQVASIARCLCEHLLRTSPQSFIGVLGLKTVADVKKQSPDILARIYHGGLCHDFGKISMIDTIFVYGRRLLDTEFEIIKKHPAMGASLLSRYQSTREYADMALGHHLSYDGTMGYPKSFAAEKSADRLLIAILTVADCLDAATDSIGRSYNEGRTVEYVREELRRDSGTRYAPEVVSLFEDPLVMEDMSFLLTNGREDNYRNAYLLLRNM